MHVDYIDPFGFVACLWQQLVGPLQQRQRPLIQRHRLPTLLLLLAQRYCHPQTPRPAECCWLRDTNMSAASGGGVHAWVGVRVCGWVGVRVGVTEVVRWVVV